eukprot:22323_6
MSLIFQRVRYSRFHPVSTEASPWCTRCSELSVKTGEAMALLTRSTSNSSLSGMDSLLEKANAAAKKAAEEEKAELEKRQVS